MGNRSKTYQTMMCLLAFGVLAVIAIVTPVGATIRDLPNASASNETFLAAIHQIGIVAPDQQAVDVANQVARMADSGASNDSLRQVVRDFGVYDYHSDAFIAAAIAAYGPNGQDSAFLAGIHQVGIVAPDQQAVDVANQVARMADSGASNDSLRQVVRDFGVYDYHSDAFIAAAIAAYGS